MLGGKEMMGEPFSLVNTKSLWAFPRQHSVNSERTTDVMLTCLPSPFLVVPTSSRMKLTVKLICETFKPFKPVSSRSLQP